ncbi:MAG: RagB/SusD family nutrient uptake outer membrane protein [Bacteroidota bacterium]
MILYYFINKCKIAIIILSAVVISSCKKLIEIKPPKSQISNDKVFEDDATATSALFGIYGNLPTTLIIDDKNMDGELSCDNAFVSGSSTALSEFATNQISVTNSRILSNLWSEPYKTIYRCNALLEGLDGSTGVTPNIKSQLRGEALFIRSMEFYFLVNYFGNVPLAISTSIDENAQGERKSVTEVYAQIVKDLEEAKGLLSATYPSTAKIRANRYAVQALLARVYLFLGNSLKAEEEATNVINSGVYTLGSLSSTFLRGSSEAILQISTLNGFATMTQAIVPANATSVPLFSFQTNFVNSFEVGDLRKSTWTKTNTVGSSSYTYSYKYKNTVTTTGANAEDHMLLRLAEQYLIRAEARANQGKLDSAKSDINKIRIRAALLPTQATSQIDILNVIEHERRMELFYELSDRWLTLKRLQKAISILAPLKGSGWQNSDTLYPIPQQEINRNPFLTQNTGY